MFFICFYMFFICVICFLSDCIWFLYDFSIITLIIMNIIIIINILILEVGPHLSNVPFFWILIFFPDFERSDRLLTLFWKFRLPPIFSNVPLFPNMIFSRISGPPRYLRFFRMSHLPRYYFFRISRYPGISHMLMFFKDHIKTIGTCQICKHIL